VFKDVVYVLKVVICVQRCGICAQGNRYVLSIVAYVPKGVIMCWEKDVICALNSGIGAQGNGYVLSIVAYVLKGVIMCWEKDVICALNSGIGAQGSDMCSKMWHMCSR
jgi:hypothetical protein